MTLSRRSLLGIGAGAVALGGAGWAGYRTFAAGRGPGGTVPDVPLGDERLEKRRSSARRKTVDFYTAVPDGHGDGRGLPVCIVLHGASTTAADFPSLGLGRFLTDAVRRGAPPFVLAGATGDRLSWRKTGDDDPQTMVHDEIPVWCAQRGFADRRAVWGWSMGGYGALLLVEAYPAFVRGVAAFSPAVSPGDDVFAGVAALKGTPVGIWCGEEDGLYDNARALVQKLPEPRAAGGFAPGEHNFEYWRSVTPAAFDFLAARLAA